MRTSPRSASLSLAALHTIPTSPRKRRPSLTSALALLWSGVGGAAAGVVLMLLPTRAAEVAPSVGVTPTGVSVASKTFRF